MHPLFEDIIISIEVMSFNKNFHFVMNSRCAAAFYHVANTDVVNLATVEIVQLVPMSVLMSCPVIAGPKLSTPLLLVGSSPPYAKPFAPVPSPAPILLCIIVTAMKSVHLALP